MGASMKAMYPINLENYGKNDQERNVVNINQERLNDNFRTITAALSELYASGEHTLKYLTARIKDGETVYISTINGVLELTNENSAEILALPNAIMQMVASSIANYQQTGDDLTPVQTAVNSVITQLSDGINMEFTNTNNAIGNTSEQLSQMNSWVRVYGAGNSLGIPPGVVIGDSESGTSFKAQGNIIFFFQGADSQATDANAVASFDGNGNFNAGSIHNSSTLLDGKFDIDVVTANSVDFLHITGRN